LKGCDNFCKGRCADGAKFIQATEIYKQFLFAEIANKAHGGRSMNRNRRFIDD
jgi:hypothetical protein